MGDGLDEMKVGAVLEISNKLRGCAIILGAIHKVRSLSKANKSYNNSQIVFLSLVRNVF